MSNVVSHTYTNATQAREYILGGRSISTFVSSKTGARFTYRVKVSDDGKCYFVGVLTGPENTSQYSYIGTINTNSNVFVYGHKSKISKDSTSVKAFAWAWANLVQDTIPEGLNIMHNGRCGHCQRILTVPESIQSGFGPVCINKS